MAEQVGKYEIGRSLGEGQFGKVKEAVDLETGARLAVKIIKKSNIKTKKDIETVKKEVKFMKILNGHPNILELQDLLEDSEKLYLVLEIAAGGDLFDRIVSVGGFTEDAARVFFKQILSGLEHCHKENIVHRDMKPENLLLGDNDILKISDFGLSNIITTTEHMLKTHCGSEKYAAPEVMQSTDPYVGPPVDIWSTGVILYIMVGGAFPFVEATMNCDLYKSLTEGRFEFPKQFSEELIDLLQRCFTIDPKERITVGQMKAHKWVNPGAAESSEMEVDPMSMMDDVEPQYRTLDPDIMSIDQANLGFEDEPVYRSLEMEAPPQQIGFGCKATETMSTMKPAAEVLEQLSTQIRGVPGAAVEVSPGTIEVEVTGSSGAPVKFEVRVETDSSGTTQVSMKRMKGHCLDYKQIFAQVRPHISCLCSNHTA